MKVLYSREFGKIFQTLPPDARRLFAKQEELFRHNWRDSRLHTKKLKVDSIAYSFRITRRYRVLFVFVEDETALFVTIGHRKDVYRN